MMKIFDTKSRLAGSHWDFGFSSERIGWNIRRLTQLDIKT